MEEIRITTDYITLGQFLKFVDVIQNGGEAKSYLAQFPALVNGETESRRGRKLRAGDEIRIAGRSFIVR